MLRICLLPLTGLVYFLSSIWTHREAVCFAMTTDFLPVVTITWATGGLMYLWLSKLTQNVCTPCPPCNPTRSDASLWCHRLAAQLQPRLLPAEPLERHPDAQRKGSVKILIRVLTCCVFPPWNPHKLWSFINRKAAFFRLSVPSTVLVFPPPGRCWWSCPSYFPGSHFPEPACVSGRKNRCNAQSMQIPEWTSSPGVYYCSHQSAFSAILPSTISWSIFSILISPASV